MPFQLRTPDHVAYLERDQGVGVLLMPYEPDPSPGYDQMLDLLDVVGYRLELVDGLWSEIGQTNDGRTAVALVGPGAWTPDDGDAASWSSAFECCLNAAGVVA